MEVDYYAKYLKYKNKYLELKEQIGGSFMVTNITEDECSKKDKKDCILLTTGKGCHWNPTNGVCKKNTCDVTDKGNKRSRVDCFTTAGCTWKNNNCIRK